MDTVEAAGGETLACIDALIGRVMHRGAADAGCFERDRVSVVIVHGFLSSIHDLRHWHRDFSTRYNVTSVGYNSLGGDFMTAAAEVSAKIKDAPSGSILVGHSLGGVLCRYAAERSPGEYAAVITVCSPNTIKYAGTGTRLTSKLAGAVPSAIDGAHGYLSDRDVWKVEGTSCHTIGAEHDLIVTERSSRLEGAEHTIIRRAGHMSVLRRPEVSESIVEIIGSYDKLYERR